MKLAAALAACLLILSPTVQAEDEKIPQITTLKGIIYKGVRITRTQGDTVTIVHEDGVKTLQFSEMDEANGKLLGFEAYKKKLAEQESANKEQEAAKKLKEKDQDAAKKQQEEKVNKKREAHIKSLSEKKNKGAEDWYELYIFQYDYQDENGTDLKKLFGRPADYQNGKSLFWSDVCWNPNTEKMEDLRVTIITLNGMLYTVFTRGDQKPEELTNNRAYIEIKEAFWALLP